MSFDKLLETVKTGTFRVAVITASGRMHCAPIYRKGEDLITAIKQGVAIAGAKTLKLVPMDGKVIDWAVAA